MRQIGRKVHETPSAGRPGHPIVPKEVPETWSTCGELPELSGPEIHRPEEMDRAGWPHLHSVGTGQQGWARTTPESGMRLKVLSISGGRKRSSITGPTRSCSRPEPACSDGTFNTSPGIPGTSTRQTQIRQRNERPPDPGGFGGSRQWDQDDADATSI